MRSRLPSLLLVVLLWGTAQPSQAEPSPVTIWTGAADALGAGNANWHTMAIMHMAMHDALNAADPVFARWWPAAADEPASAGALPQAAMEAAAGEVLLRLHPATPDGVRQLLADRLAGFPAGEAREAGIRLGTAIADTAVARRQGDGFERSWLFPGSDVPGSWRPTPPTFRSSGTTATRPFLFANVADAGGLPPPVPGSAAYLRDVAETRRVGGGSATERTAEQAEAALFWAYQSTQRGFVHLAVTMVDTGKLPHGLAGQARAMAQMSAAMADSAILVWDAKAHWSYWRPVTAINTGAFGVAADPSWSSFIETPPHPEYPSGHASDCYTGALFLRDAFGTDAPFVYTAQSPAPTKADPAETWTTDIGAPPPPVELVAVSRPFPSLTEAAQNCADSRIWAGAHFRSANEESRQIAAHIVARALAAVPALAPAP